MARRRRLFGPFTLVALLVAVGLSVTALRPERGQPAQAQPIDLDELRREIAGRPSPPPLWKPEPALLVEHAETLALRPDQLHAIRGHAQAWTTERTALEESIRAAAPPGTRTTETGLRAGMQSVSELSRAFDLKRKGHWDAALAVLDAPQREKVETLRRSGGMR